MDIPIEWSRSLYIGATCLAAISLEHSSTPRTWLRLHLKQPNSTPSASRTTIPIAKSINPKLWKPNFCSHGHFISDSGISRHSRTIREFGRSMLPPFSLISDAVKQHSLLSPECLATVQQLSGAASTTAERGSLPPNPLSGGHGSFELSTVIPYDWVVGRGRSRCFYVYH